MGNGYDFSSGKYSDTKEMKELAKDAEVIDAKLIEVKTDAYDPTINSKSLHENLKVVYQEMLNKYNIKDVEFKDFETVIVNLADYTKKTSEYNKLFLSRLTNAIAESTQINCIFVLGKLINTAISKALEVVEKEINTDPDHSLNVCVSIINQAFAWLQQVDSLKVKYNIHGDDGALTNLSKQTSAKQESLSNEKIREIIAKINKATSGLNSDNSKNGAPSK